MKQSHNSQQFIEQFNLIDKFFDHLLGNERFMPYNEKLKTIRQGGFALSRFVNIHQRELKYLGEIRNLLSHGLKIQGKELWCPTEHALTLLATYHDAITSPPTCYTLFKKPVYHAHMHDSLLGIVNNNIDHVHHIPLYDK